MPDFPRQYPVPTALGEVIYDEPDVKFPWSLSPLLPENKHLRRD